MTVKRTKKKRRGSNLYGKLEYADHLKGVKNTRKQAMLAKCYECMGEYDGGKQDCMGRSCPLYPYYPYKGRVT